MNIFTTVSKSLALALLLAAAAHAATPATPAAPARVAHAVGGKVNINAATAAELDRVLVNIGPAKAQAIIDYRQANGPFKSADELALVRGIGLKTVERNRDLIEVGAPAARARPAAAAAATTTTAVKPVERR